MLLSWSSYPSALKLTLLKAPPPNKFDGEAEYYDFLDEQGWA